ncbi:ABC transporter ATP-binding protein [Massilia horti]|uniref:ABC transporter ATP-binding protein n=2 Tax=Massilia horti TaxID=2562153 RepID=A0A4Y9SM40_9BURK|nr:ABC transporter ATP-binding protein [Massilia horti]
MFAVRALHDIHLEVEPGEMLAVCGPSGHGKTTLLNLIGLLDTASAGEVEFDGKGVASLSEAQRALLRASTVGLVFQSFSLVPVLTAQDNVLLPLQLRARLTGAERKAAAEQAAELLARLGLASHVRHYPARLDAGQCQRVAIARALITRPRLVVADEPTSRLDSGFVRMVSELFASYQREYGTTFVISTRDQRQLARATRTLQLADGRLLAAPADTARRPLRMHQ